MPNVEGQANPNAPIIDVLRGGIPPFDVHLAPFEKIPSIPGVYCWFYPLYLSSDHRIQDCLEELRKVHMFIFESEVTATKPLQWYEGYTSFQLKDRPLTSPSHGEEGKWETIWKDLQKDGNEAVLKEFKRVIMKATFWMPPLYIGVAKDLSTRCKTHLHSGGFNSRFQAYAKKMGLKSRTINDLVLATISTSISPADELNEEAGQLAEEILKRVGRPSYSER